MGKKDPRIDAYIAKAAPFAKPILKHARAVVHRACPDVEETLKWGHPTFMYKGMLCGIATFKEHASFGFWKSKLVLDGRGKPADEGFGSFGKLTKLSDLPSEEKLTGYIRKAMVLNDAGVTVKREKTAPKKAIPMPADFKLALAASKKAGAAFDAFPPSHKRDYLEWITEAKQEATRAKRLDQAIEWIASGKPRNWKYMKKPAGGW